MKVAGGTITLLEEVVWDEATRTVEFILQDHPKYTGSVINRVDIKTNEEGKEELYLTFIMNWAWKLEGEDPMSSGPQGIEGAVKKSIAYIENETSKQE